MKKTKKIIAIILIIFIFSTILNVPKIEVKASNTMDVLYIGNSKTFYNIFPRMYRKLSIAAGKTDPRLKAIVAGGRALQEHATKLESIYTSKGNLRNYSDANKYSTKLGYAYKNEDEYNAYVSAFSKNWSYIVLQEKTNSAKNENEMYESSQRIINILKKYGKNKDFKIIYNAIWGKYPDTNKYKTYDEQLQMLKIEQNKINITNKNVADKTGGVVSYSGQAIYNYLKEYRSKGYSSMYISDKNHPTQAASYMAACCLYAAMYNQTPVGINYKGNVKDAKSNPIINLNYPANHSVNDSDFTGRKELGELNDRTIRETQYIAEKTMIKKSPIINSIVSSNTNYTNRAITITVNAQENAFDLDANSYSWDGQRTWVPNNSVTVGVNSTYTVYVRDILGNISAASIQVSNIDTTLPKITSINYSTTEKTNQSIVITVNAIDNESGILGYSWDKGNTWTMNNTFEVSNNGEYTVYVKDKAENITGQNIVVSNIDKTQPIGTVNYSTTEKTKGPVIVTINSNKELQNISGWTLSQDKKSLTKMYTKNTKETLEIIDLIGNKNTVIIEINNIEEELKITSSKYKIYEGYIINIKPETKVSVVKSDIKSNKEYEIQKTDGTKLTENDIVATGYKVKFAAGETYEIVVNGDVSGNGKITITDVAKIKKHIINTETLTGAYLKAGDVNGNDTITITDLAKIKKVVIGLENL